jgi:hypothetical protein
LTTLGNSMRVQENKNENSSIPSGMELLSILLSVSLIIFINPQLSPHKN